MSQSEADEKLRLARSMGHARAPDAEIFPQPPYQLRGCSFLMIGAEFERAEAAKLIPSGLEVADEATGGFYVYSAPMGWGIAPYTATLAWIDVKGHDSTDGSHGRFMVFGGYSGAAYEALKDNAAITAGYSEFVETESDVEGIGGPTGGVYLRMCVTKTHDAPVPADGTHYYLASTQAGGLSSSPVAFSYDFNAATPKYLEILAPPETPLGQMAPKRLTWAGWLTNGVITIGHHSPIVDRPGVESTMSSARYLNFLTQVGKAAIAIKPDNSVVFQNDAAEKLAGDGFWLTQRRFRVAEEVAEAWSVAMRAALQPLAPLSSQHPVGLPRRASSTPLIAQLVPYQDVVVVLITDPERGFEREPHRALQILGLTPAEARIGVLIGEGLEAQSVADRLGNSVSTVRSSMKAIYDKLGIRKQSELSRIVARLSTIGI